MAKRIVREAEENKINTSTDKAGNTLESRITQNPFSRLKRIDRRKLFSQSTVIALVLLVSIGALAQLGLKPVHNS